MLRAQVIPAPSLPSPGALLELLKPVTWFAPMWAFMCGVVSAGGSFRSDGFLWLAGMILAGPLVCAASQAINDWFDRHVDAINQPARPIPSGRIAGRWGLWIAITWTAMSLLFAVMLGHWVLWAAAAGLLLSWLYSAPPLRLKQSGWWGPAAVALSYEGLTWFAGAAMITSALPNWRILVVAGLYSFGAHGIMTLNDFKAVDGDRQLGIRSLPVTLGVDAAARLACATMAGAQALVLFALLTWGRAAFAAVIAALLAAQFVLMTRLLRDPRRLAPWYNATGTSLYVLGMLVAAFAVRALGGVLP
jgi:chlorophyll synthase